MSEEVENALFYQNMDDLTIISCQGSLMLKAGISRFRIVSFIFRVFSSVSLFRLFVAEY